MSTNDELVRIISEVSQLQQDLMKIEEEISRHPRFTEEHSDVAHKAFSSVICAVSNMRKFTIDNAENGSSSSGGENTITFRTTGAGDLVRPLHYPDDC